MPHTFVSEFPADECRAVAGAILSGKFTAEMIRSAWVVAEFGLGELVPANLVGSRSPGFPSEEERQQAAMALLAMADPSPERTLATAPPWLQLVKIILALILEQI